MKVTINREECTSCGTCWETCPDMFEENPDDSLNQIVEKYRLKRNNAEGVPPEAFEDCTVRAAELCCAEVIHVEESWNEKNEVTK
jgi:ferredoxin